MSEQQSNLVPIAVAIVGVVGSIVVAMITSRNTFDQEFEKLEANVDHIVLLGGRASLGRPRLRFQIFPTPRARFAVNPA